MKINLMIKVRMVQTWIVNSTENIPIKSWPSFFMRQNLYYDPGFSALLYWVELETPASFYSNFVFTWVINLFYKLVESFSLISTHGKQHLSLWWSK